MQHQSWTITMTYKAFWQCVAVLAFLALASAGPTVPLTINPSALPLSRPEPWPLRGFADAVAYGVNKTINGALNVWVEHKAIPGVTAAMMYWWFPHIKDSSVDPRDNVSYPNYLLFHPIDHVKHSAAPLSRTGAFQPGSTMLGWSEFPLTGCTQQPANKWAPWDCADGRQGYTQSTDPTLYKGVHQTNATMKLVSYTRSGIVFALEVTNDMGITGQGITVTHAWRDTPAGLKLRSQQMVGVDSPLGLLPMVKQKGSINDAIIDGYRGSLSATAAGYLNVLHFIEEYGNLANIMPFVYKPPPSPASRRRSPSPSPASRRPSPAPRRSTTAARG